MWEAGLNKEKPGGASESCGQSEAVPLSPAGAAGQGSGPVPVPPSPRSRCPRRELLRRRSGMGPARCPLPHTGPARAMSPGGSPVLPAQSTAIAAPRGRVLGVGSRVFSSCRAHVVSLPAPKSSLLGCVCFSL